MKPAQGSEPKKLPSGTAKRLLFSPLHIHPGSIQTPAESPIKGRKIHGRALLHPAKADSVILLSCFLIQILPALRGAQDNPQKIPVLRAGMRNIALTARHILRFHTGRNSKARLPTAAHPPLQGLISLNFIHGRLQKLSSPFPDHYFILRPCSVQARIRERPWIHRTDFFLPPREKTDTIPPSACGDHKCALFSSKSSKEGTAPVCLID